MATMIVTCRTCKSSKFRGDICPTCTAGAQRQTLQVHKGMPISLGQMHGFHGEAMGVSSARAHGNYR